MERGHFPQNHRASKGSKRDDITYQSLQTKELVLRPYLFTPNNKLMYIDANVFHQLSNDILKCLL